MRKIKTRITKDRLIVLIVSIAWSLIAIMQFGTVLNNVFDFTDIVYRGVVIGENIVVKENIINIIHVVIMIIAVILFILRKKTGWILLAICMVWQIITLALFDIESFGQILHRIHSINASQIELGMEPIDRSLYVPQFIKALCKMLIAIAFQGLLLWLICIKRIRNMYQINNRTAIIVTCIAIVLVAILYLIFGNSIIIH